MKVYVIDGAYHRSVGNVLAEVKNGRSIKTEVVGSQMACGAIEGGPDDPAWRYQWAHRAIPVEKAQQQGVRPCARCFSAEVAS